MKSSSPAEVLITSHRRLLGFVERRVGDRGTAEEILQAAFVRGLEKMPELRDADKVLPWFYQLLRNAIAAHYRRRGVEQRALEAVGRERRTPRRRRSSRASSASACTTCCPA